MPLRVCLTLFTVADQRPTNPFRSMMMNTVTRSNSMQTPIIIGASQCAHVEHRIDRACKPSGG